MNTCASCWNEAPSGKRLCSRCYRGRLDGYDYAVRRVLSMLGVSMSAPVSLAAVALVLDKARGDGKATAFEALKDAQALHGGIADHPRRAFYPGDFDGEPARIELRWTQGSLLWCLGVAGGVLSGDSYTEEQVRAVVSRALEGAGLDPAPAATLPIVGL